MIKNIYVELTDKFNDGRELLSKLPCSIAELEKELDAERRKLMHANEERLLTYGELSRKWADKWPEVQSLSGGRSLTEAHGIIIKNAEGVLPFTP